MTSDARDSAAAGLMADLNAKHSLPIPSSMSKHFDGLVGTTFNRRAVQEVVSPQELQPIVSELFLSKTRLSDDEKCQIFDTLTELCVRRTHNANIFANVGLAEVLLKQLSASLFYKANSAEEEKTNAVKLSKILRLFNAVSCHRFTHESIMRVLRIFTLKAFTDNLPDDSKTLLLISTLEAIAREPVGPNSMFYFSGQHSGIVIPPVNEWPGGGYTVCMWIRLDIVQTAEIPLYTFRGPTGEGISVWIDNLSLIARCHVSRKAETGATTAVDVLDRGRWQCISVVHSHRMVLGSKLEIYKNGILRHSSKLSYPATSKMSPVYGFIGLAGGGPDGTLGPKNNSHFQGALGPILVFASACTAKEMAVIKTVEEFDKRATCWDQEEETVAIFSGGGPPPILFAYNPRNYDLRTGVIYDSGPCTINARVFGNGTKFCFAQPLKETMWHLGGPTILFPLLLPVGKKTFAPISQQPIPQLITTFALGPQSFAAMLSVISELLRVSPVNQMLFRKHHGARMLSILIRVVPRTYLTNKLVTSVKRLVNNVSQDRILSDEALHALCFDLRLWHNASLDVQNVVFDAMKEIVRVSALSPTVVSIPSMLRQLRLLYSRRNVSHPSLTEEQLATCREQLMQVLQLLLCEHSVASKKTTLSLPSIKKLVEHTVIQTDEVRVADLMALYLSMLTSKDTQDGLTRHMTALGGITCLSFALLVSRESDELRAMGLRTVRAYISQRKDKDGLKSLSISAEEVSVLESALMGRHLSYGCYRELMALMLGLSVDHEDENEKLDSIFEDRKALANSNVAHPLLLPTILKLLRHSCFAVKLEALEHLHLFLCEKATGKDLYRHSLATIENWLVLLMDIIVGKDLCTSSCLSSARAQAGTRIATHGEEEALVALPGSNRGIEELVDLLLVPSTPFEEARQAIMELFQREEGSLPSFRVKELLMLDGRVHFLAQRGPRPSVKRLLASATQSHYSEAMCGILLDSVVKTLEHLCFDGLLHELESWTMLERTLLWLEMESIDVEIAHAFFYRLLSGVLKKIVRQLETTRCPFRGSIYHENILGIARLGSNFILGFYPGFSATAAAAAVTEEENYKRATLQLPELLIHIWQYVGPTLEPDIDGSFSVASRTAMNSEETRRRSLASTSSTNTLASDQAVKRLGSSYAGGTVRQILQLLLLTCHIWASQCHDYRQANEMIVRLRYYLQILKLGPGTASIRNSSLLLSGGIGVNGGTGGIDKPVLKRSTTVVDSSNEIIAPAGPETSMALWLVNELYGLATAAIADAGAMSAAVGQYHDSASVEAQHIQHQAAVDLCKAIVELMKQFLSRSNINSFAELESVMSHTDFVTTKAEVARRDQFYHETILASWDRRRLDLVEEKTKTRELELSNRLRLMNKRDELEKTIGHRSLDTEEGLEKMEAVRDEEDVQQLRLLIRLATSMRGVWYENVTARRNPDSSRGSGIAASPSSSATLGPVSSPARPSTTSRRSTGIEPDEDVENKHWKLDMYETSKRMRRRLLPDVDGVDYASYLATAPSAPKGQRAGTAQSSNRLSASSRSDSGRSSPPPQGLGGIFKGSPTARQERDSASFSSRSSIARAWTSSASDLAPSTSANIDDLMAQMSDLHLTAKASFFLDGEDVPAQEDEGEDAENLSVGRGSVGSATHPAVSSPRMDQAMPDDVDDFRRSSVGEIPEDLTAAVLEESEALGVDLHAIDSDAGTLPSATFSGLSLVGHPQKAPLSPKIMEELKVKTVLDLDLAASDIPILKLNDRGAGARTEALTSNKTSPTAASSFANFSRRLPVSFLSGKASPSASPATADTSSAPASAAGPSPVSRASPSKAISVSTAAVTSKIGRFVPASLSRRLQQKDSNISAVSSADSEVTTRTVSGRALSDASSTEGEVNGDKGAVQPNNVLGEYKVSPPSTPVAPSTPSSQKRSHDVKSIYNVEAELITPTLVVKGLLTIGRVALAFDGKKVIKRYHLQTKIATTASDVGVGKKANNEENVAKKRRLWNLRIIQQILPRRYMLKQTAVEIFFIDGTTLLLNFSDASERVRVYQTVRERKPPVFLRSAPRSFPHPDKLIKHMGWTTQWQRHEISNFEYLMILNTFTGRSYNDITQYPIFPWIIKDYESENIDLDNPSTYRDLAKPIGAQSPSRLRQFRERYEAMKLEDAGTPPYLYGTHYSNSSIVLSYLLRLEPFTSVALKQAVFLHNPDSILHSILETWNHCLGSKNDVRELTPEWFYLPEFLLNANRIPLGQRASDGQSVDNVLLPPWAKTPEDFIRLNREALESDYVSSKLHLWIDLIFGCKQRGQAAIDADNVFHYLTYENAVDFSSISDAEERRKAETQIAQYGQSPTVLFRKPHPQRLSKEDALAVRYPNAHAAAALVSRRQVRRQEIKNSHKTALTNILFGSDQNLLYTVDKDGFVVIFKYLSAVADAKGFPSTIEPLNQSWKLQARVENHYQRTTCLFQEQLISGGYWDGCWRVLWANEGEIVQRVAFHTLPISCINCSRDPVTGDLAIACGSDDGTVSLWALPHSGASKRRIFGKVEIVVDKLPWQLLHGHGSKITAVALHADLDVVVSASGKGTCLVHTLRTAHLLHTLMIPAPPHQTGTIVGIAISNDGLVAVHQVWDNTSYLYLFTVNAGFLTGLCTLEDGSVDLSVSASGVPGEDVSINATPSGRSSPTIVTERRLVDDIIFSACGTYLVTATTGANGGISVRYARDLRIHRHVEIRPSSPITAVSLSPDERCIIAGMEDGSLFAYALHFGLGTTSDEAKAVKAAKANEAAAVAAAAKRDLVAQSRAGAVLFDWFGDRKLNEMDKKAVLHMRRGKAGPSKAAMDHLSECFDGARTAVAAGDPEYEALLQRLWTSVYTADTPFERVGQGWTDLGFQRPDPTTDFRAGGILSLRCLVYFAEKYTSEMRRMQQLQIPDAAKSTYPVCPAGINITSMVASMLWHSDGELNDSRESIWPWFEDQPAFYELYSGALLLFDTLWTGMQAKYMGFAVVLQSTKQELEEMFAQEPPTLQIFQLQIAQRAQRGRGIGFGRAPSFSTLSAAQEHFLRTPSPGGILPSLPNMDSLNSAIAKAKQQAQEALVDIDYALERFIEPTGSYSEAHAPPPPPRRLPPPVPTTDILESTDKESMLINFDSPSFSSAAPSTAPAGPSSFDLFMGDGESMNVLENPTQGTVLSIPNDSFLQHFAVGTESLQSNNVSLAGISSALPGAAPNPHFSSAPSRPEQSFFDPFGSVDLTKPLQPVAAPVSSSFSQNTNGSTGSYSPLLDDPFSGISSQTFGTAGTTTQKPVSFSIPAPDGMVGAGPLLPSLQNSTSKQSQSKEDPFAGLF